jgi:hypothetical protein
MDENIFEILKTIGLSSYLSAYAEDPGLCPWMNAQNVA